WICRSSTSCTTWTARSPAACDSTGSGTGRAATATCRPATATSASSTFGTGRCIDDATHIWTNWGCGSRFGSSTRTAAGSILRVCGRRYVWWADAKNGFLLRQKIDHRIQMLFFALSNDYRSQHRDVQSYEE